MRPALELERAAATVPVSGAVASLMAYGLSAVATVSVADRRFIITITNHDIVALERCIYAFVRAERILRIGSSKARLKTRFRSWERDVTNALQGRKSPTPAWEAAAWEQELANGPGVVLARPGTMVTTPVGTFSAYLDEESILIGRHAPPLNRSKHR